MLLKILIYNIILIEILAYNYSILITLMNTLTVYYFLSAVDKKCKYSDI